MRQPFWMGLILISALLLASCSRQEKAEGTPLVGDPEVGGIYSLNDGEGGFRVGKVIAVEEAAIFIHLYDKRWTSRPSRTLAKTAVAAMPLAYSPQSFGSMQPLHLEGSSVSAEELSTYETWRRSKRRLF